MISKLNVITRRTCVGSMRTNYEVMSRSTAP